MKDGVSMQAAGPMHVSFTFHVAIFHKYRLEMSARVCVHVDFLFLCAVDVIL